MRESLNFMKTSNQCNACGVSLPADAPEGLCPRCLGAAAVDTQSHKSSGVQTEVESQPARKPAQPPSIAEVARCFPDLEILELLGQGGMGIVYKARQPRLDRFVALKILSEELAGDPAFAERFSREARALAKLSHPNIVAVHDFGEAGKLFYITMEFVDGVNLRQLEQARRLTPQEALGIVPKICEALQYAHDEGIVHRDIKPGNILIDKRGRVKIADFGLAKLAGKPAGDLTLTQSRQIMGTPHYMAPEQMERPLEVDHRADIYSLGVVLYEMLTGELPLGRFALPSQKVQVDVRVDEVVLKSLEKELVRRYQHASEVRTDVESIAAGGAVEISNAAGAVRNEDESGNPILKRRIQNAALALIVSAVLNLIALPLLLTLLRILRPDFYSSNLGTLAGVLLPPALVYGFVIFCARRMRRLESYRLAIGGSILFLAVTIGDLIGLAVGPASGFKILTPGNIVGLAMGGGILLPGHLIGIPAAVWALSLLRRPEIRGCFAPRSDSVGSRADASTKAESGETQSASPLMHAWENWWSNRNKVFTKVIKTLLIAVYLVCLLIFFSYKGSVSVSADGFSHEIGFPTPWFVVEKHFGEDGGGHGVSIKMLSSSWLFGGLGALACYVYLQIKRSDGTYDRKEHLVLTWIPVVMLVVAIGVSMAPLILESFRSLR